MSSKNTLIHRLWLKCLGTFIFTILTFSSFSQFGDLYVKKINAQAIDGRVYITWTTQAGFSCQDIHIEVSSDSLQNFERRGTYFGLCGDTLEKDYFYSLEKPIVNRINYIKLELGNFGYSRTISVLVIKPQEEVFIIPHPANTSSQIYFKNPLNEKTKIDFYSSSGEFLETLSTIGNSFSLSGAKLPNGLIIYVIKGENTINYRGRILFDSFL